MEKASEKELYRFPEVFIQLVQQPSQKLQEPIDNERKATDYMCTLLSCRTVENLAIVTVDSRIRPINYSIISRGTVDQACYSPSEIIRLAILSNAAGILIYHNHPSGVPSPSLCDDIAAENIWKCTQLFHIILHDFIILGNQNNYYSYRSEERGPFSQKNC